MLEKKNILGVDVTAADRKTVLEHVIKFLKNDKKDSKVFIVTPNPEILVYANSHPDYKKILNGAQISLVDGVGLLVGAKILGKGPLDRFTGVDFIENLCLECKDQPISMGFLGGRTGVAEKAAECLQAKYPWIKVAFVAEEWGESANGKWQMANSSVVRPSAISHTPYASIDILFVAFGAPRQEEWIAQHLEKLPVRAAMGVGGSFDYISGEVRRAPVWIRNIGLEWLFRLILQPWRWRRQLALVEFGWLVMRARLGLYQSDNV